KLPAQPVMANAPAGPVSTVSDQGTAFMVEKEAFIPFRYFDVARNATIGYGHHRGLTADQIDAQFPDGLTESQAWDLFKSDIGDFADSVAKRVPGGLEQSQFDAMVMVAFGKGNINSELPHLVAGDHEAVADSIASITTAGGVFNAGVAKRYGQVADLYRHGIYPQPKLMRSELRLRGIRLIEKLYPNKLNSVGNKFGLPTEQAQRKQAEESYFRMTHNSI
ncbi:MAG: glycoside hydrolase family protein, partial [Pseudomonadota bacterium]